MPVNNAFIAAILTVVGYSINATIVIFDRIRENKKLQTYEMAADLINDSVKQTLTRSFYTSITTFFAIGAVYVFGVESVKEFALPIMVGVVSGVYSSVFLSGAFWYSLLGKDKSVNYEEDDYDEYDETSGYYEEPDLEDFLN